VATHLLLPAAHLLLPVAHLLLPVAHLLLPAAYLLLLLLACCGESGDCLPLAALCLPAAYLLHATHTCFHVAYHFLLSSDCILLAAFNSPRTAHPTLLTTTTYSLLLTTYSPLIFTRYQLLTTMNSHSSSRFRVLLVVCCSARSGAVLVAMHSVRRKDGQPPIAH
jgi:hypothetical protein